MGTNPTYSDKQLIDSLTVHCIDNHLSKYTKAYPTWQGYLKRMDKDADLADKVNELLCVADQWFEKKGLDALHDKDFNNVMFAKLTNNKPFTKDHTTVELENILNALEEKEHEK